MRRAAVIGAGLHPYGKWEQKGLVDLARPAIDGALETAGIGWEQIESGWCGHTNQGMTAGARIFAKFGRTGLSITNVENASATGSYAFRGAVKDVASGEFDLAIALGIDKRPKTVPMGMLEASELHNSGNKQFFSPVAAFAEQTRQHMEKYGTTIDQVATVSVKQHHNASLNPNAQYRNEVTLEEVHSARMVADPLTVLHCCPFGDGAAAVVVASEDAAERLGIKKPVWVAASVSKSEPAPEAGGPDITTVTAEEAYRRAGIGPDDLGMVELHDAFTIEEIIQAENLGLCSEGEGGKLVESGATEVGGRIPINTSGGLLAMGHPFGPTGVGQIAEIFWQLRGEAGERQIPSQPRTGLAQMVGLGGICIIHILETEPA